MRNPVTVGPACGRTLFASAYPASRLPRAPQTHGIVIGTFFRCSLAALLLASPAAADDSSGTRRYCADFFAAAAPASAYDMVQMLPGFTLVDADADVRGYAGAQGNVLLDGTRPSSKRQSMEQLLKRIPARAVTCIELLREGSGIDLLGHSVLANVLRAESTDVESAVQTGVLASDDDWSRVIAQGEYARQTGDRKLEFALSSTPELDEDSGEGRIVTQGADGRLGEDHATETRRIQVVDQSSLGWRQPLGAGTLYLDGALRDSRDRSAGRIRSQLPEAFDEVNAEDDSLQEAEFVARYTRNLDEHSRLEAVASQQLGWLDTASRSHSEDEDEQFAQRTRSGESIARVDVHHERTPELELSAAIELAFNRLDGDASLIENGSPVELPGSHVHIEERRGEFGGALSWRTSDSWRVDAGLTTERSTLKQTGDSTLTRDFSYLKPRVAMTWARSAREQWRASLSRQVGQLAFEDFVASASLDSGIVNAGNAELEPDKTWRAALSWERRFAGDSAMVVTLSHDAISDVVDRVPVQGEDELFDAPGNIGNGIRDGLMIEYGGKLLAFGFDALRFNSKLLWQRSRVRDPATGRMRPISEDKPLEGAIALTHALPAYRASWGLRIALAERETDYRIDAVSTERVDASWRLFGEVSMRRHWRLRAELVDAFGRDIHEDRALFEDRGIQNMPGAYQQRRHRMPGQLMVTLRREIGD